MAELSRSALRYLKDAPHGSQCTHEKHLECAYVGDENGIPVWTCDESLSEAACKTARVCSCGLNDLRRAIRG